MDIVTLLTDVEEGNISALKAYIELKKEADLLASALKQVKEAAIEEAETYGKGEHQAHGAKFQVKNAAGKYSYKHIDNWRIIKEELTALETSYKLAAQEAEKGRQFITEDGEIIPPANYTPGATTISIFKL